MVARDELISIKMKIDNERGLVDRVFFVRKKQE